MADLVPQAFPTPADNYTINFNFQDFLNNVGYVSFYPAGIKTTSNVDQYLLTSISSFRSSDLNFSSTGATGNKDFDGSVNKNFMISGAYAYGVIAYGATNNASATMTITLYRYDGVTEYQIATATISPLTGGSGKKYVYNSFKMLCTPTIMKKGDTLRLSIEWSSANVDFTLYFDPSARLSSLTELNSGASFRGDTVINIPVVIQI